MCTPSLAVPPGVCTAPQGSGNGLYSLHELPSDRDIELSGPFLCFSRTPISRVTLLPILCLCLCFSLEDVPLVDCWPGGWLRRSMLPSAATRQRRWHRRLRLCARAGRGQITCLPTLRLPCGSLDPTRRDAARVCWTICTGSTYGHKDGNVQATTKTRAWRGLSLG